MPGVGTGGANKLAREVTDALATMPAAVEAIAGKEMVRAPLVAYRLQRPAKIGGRSDHCVGTPALLF